jgi:hypothetical protein
MRITIRLDDTLAAQVAAAREERGLETAALVREALTVYLSHAVEDRPGAPPSAPAAQSSPTLDACVATLLRHWPPEIQARLTAEMTWTGLSARDYLLGIAFAWATRR